ncbi:MAG: ABC transporter ATP-binding protein [Lachnospiraceae bacterium]|nr:ABC transporter ATP-binding protein [Lachnospiraceae bacterium]
MKIETDKLCKQFTRHVNDVNDRNGRKNSHKEDFFAVDHVSMHADSGEILGVLGPNGAGKTTLLRMLGTLMHPSEGSVYIRDDEGNTVTDPVVLKKNIGYLSGNTKLYNRFSIREMLSMLAEIYGMDKDATDKRIEEIIDILSMKDFADNRIGALSTGQTQRANIARCLIHSPKVYIFDEPTLGLDLLSSEAIVNFMKSEREHGRTVLYSTHYMEEAQYLCDRINMLYKGRIIADGTPEELMKQTGTSNLRETFRALINRTEGGNE